MGVPRAVRDRYALDRDPLNALDRHVTATLAGWCKDSRYAFDSRVKDLESAAEKLETGRYESWLKLDDLVAATIVVPTRSHEAGVLDRLNALFDCETVRSRGSAWMAPEVFRFDATRWYGRVEKHPSSQLDPRSHDLMFEVQIRTAFEHAWVTVTHDVVYKSQTVDWKSKRLAAQLKATVEQIDLLIDGFQSAASGIPNARDAITEGQHEVIESFAQLADDGLLDANIHPASWQRFSENVFQVARKKARRSRETADVAINISNGLTDAIRAGEFAVALSGSLFQAVLAYIARSSDAAILDDFPIVWSEELETLYNVSKPPTTIALE